VYKIFNFLLVRALFIKLNSLYTYTAGMPPVLLVK